LHLTETPAAKARRTQSFRAIINAAGSVKNLLEHIGESSRPSRIAPALGPPLWEAAAAAEQAGKDLHRNSSARPAPEIEFDRRIAV